MMSSSACAIIWDAGKQSFKHSPALGRVLFKPILSWILDAVKESGIEASCAVSSHCPELEPLLSRGQAAFPSMEEAQGFFSGYDAVLLIAANAPFINPDAIRDSYEMFRANGAQMCLLASQDAEPAAAWVNTALLCGLLPSLEGDFCDAAGKLADACGLAVTYKSEDPLFSRKACSRWELYELGEAARMKVIRRHMENGVEFASLDGVIIGPDVTIGEDTLILPGTIIKGKSAIGESCTIGPNSLIEDSVIGNETTFNASQMFESTLGDQVKVGPFCHLRPGSRLEDRVKVGDFVEIKNSVIGEKTSLAHLTYIGDSDIGRGINFGGGCITCNYDGKTKHRTVVEDHAFIGCNTNLVAPVKVGEGAFIAAGSTITKDVEPYALAIARGRQTQKEDWAKAWFEDKK